MIRRRVVTALLMCGLVVGCGKSNDPPTDPRGPGPVPKSGADHGYDKPKGQATTGRGP